MAPARSAASSNDSALHTARRRILRQARADFFTQGYSRFTMDALAVEVGMSKKTLYVHFAGKDEIVGAVIDDLAAEIRADADALLQDRNINLAEKLRGFIEGMMTRMATLTPQTLRDLQRFAPGLYAKVEAVRGTVLPYVFGRLVEQGQEAGLVRATLPPGYAIEFLLYAVQGLMHPAALERLRMTPREVLAMATDLFFGGLLTNAGRKQYEKLFPR